MRCPLVLKSYSSLRPVTKGGRIAALEKCVEYSLNILEPSPKPLRPTWCPKLVTGLVLLIAWNSLARVSSFVFSLLMWFWPLVILKQWLIYWKCSKKWILGSTVYEKKRISDSRSVQNISDRRLRIEVQAAQNNVLERVKRFVNVCLHCIVKNLKRISKIWRCSLRGKFRRTPMWMHWFRSNFCVIKRGVVWFNSFKSLKNDKCQSCQFP